MEKHTFKVSKRTISGRKVSQLRKKGLTPGNVFGKHITSFAVEMDSKDFLAIFQKAGETGLLELSVDGEMHPVLIHHVSYHPVSSKTLHVDFLEVNLKEKVTTKVPVVLVGEAIAVKDKVGVILTLLNELEVEALPMDLPDKIEVDVSHLAKVGETIKISDLKVSEKVKIITSVENDLVKVAPLVSKEAEKMAAEEAAAAAAAAATTAVSAGQSEGTPAASENAPSSASAQSPKKEDSAKK